MPKSGNLLFYPETYLYDEMCLTLTAQLNRRIFTMLPQVCPLVMHSFLAPAN